MLAFVFIHIPGGSFIFNIFSSQRPFRAAIRRSAFSGFGIATWKTAEGPRSGD
jgi:hypothetical protein